ncbi:MAG: hypothetical protein JWR59_506, partial [Brevundimonas sp.]|nr:hypothetical protein [Brevundimonas sp.]
MLPFNIDQLDPGRVVDIDVASEETRSNWLSLAAEWATRPPFYVMIGGKPEVIVSRYADVRKVFMSPADFRTTPPPMSGPFANFPHVGQTDGAQHDRLRRILQPWFGPAGIAAYNDRIEAHIDALLDEIEARGDAVDLVRDFTHKLVPRIMLGTMFGLEEDRYDIFVKMNRAMNSGGDPRSIIDPFSEARVLVDQIIAERSAAPTDDFITALIQARQRGDGVTDEEIVANVLAICVAAMSTTSTTTAMALLRWTRNRADFAQVLDDPALMAGAVEECLRLHPAGLFVFPRYANADIEVGGTKIWKEMRMHMCVAAADLDPTVYADPLRFDIRRNPKLTLIFGAGMHFCAG